MSEEVSLEGKAGLDECEETEYKFSLDFDDDEDWPMLSVDLVVGQRWGDHSYFSFTPFRPGATKDTILEHTIEDAKIAIDALYAFRDHTAEIMTRLENIHAELLVRRNSQEK